MVLAPLLEAVAELFAVTGCGRIETMENGNDCFVDVWAENRWFEFLQPLTDGVLYASIGEGDHWFFRVASDRVDEFSRLPEKHGVAEVAVHGDVCEGE